MAFIMAKIFTGLVLLLGSLLALRHVGAGSDFAKGPTALRLLRLARLFGHGHDHRNLDGEDVISNCEKCLAEGQDFCISGNACIPRATFQCRGPYDHITGDKEFALHGNPEGIHHAMSCSTPNHVSHHASESENIDTKDCYFDKECHAKVDWAKISHMKAGFLVRLKYFKEKKDVHGVKEMMGKVHELFHAAGMPEDRIDYTIVKWVKGIYPEALDNDMEDCYFDEKCHAKVDWAKITPIKAVFFARLKYLKEMKDPHGVKEMIGMVHRKFHDAGMPEDRIDYMLVKWVESVFPESLTGAPREDGLHMPMCAVAKERCTKDGEPVLHGRCGVQWKACEHEKSAHLSKKGAGDDKIDVKDCYFDKECHSKVDWERIKKIKRGIFMRLKVYKKAGNKDAAKKAIEITHRLFQKAGMPDDRIDYVLNKWVKHVYPEVLQNSATTVTV